MIISPAFQCAEKISPECDVYTLDTAILNISLPSNNGVYEVLDTVHFLSAVSDTIRSVKGKEFQSPINTLNANIQVYKVVTTNNNSILNYANIEFNPIVNDGSFENNSSLGYSFLYRRISPFNRLDVSFVAGFRGLYLFVIRNSSNFGSSIKEPNNDCASYFPVCFINESQQQKQYWDSLGISSLRLAGNNSFTVANKDDKNYFFVKVD